MTYLLINSLIYLVAIVLAVPISKRLGLGTVLGYLIAGVVIGPILHLVGDEAKAVQHVAEFGVVMMLFLVGLGLKPQVLWSLRHRLLGLGGLQVALTVLAITLISIAIGVFWKTAFAIGLILSVSSTAIVLRTLSEKGLMKTNGGQSSFAVLLFQDLAIIPMLALIPFLALPELATVSMYQTGHDSINLLSGLSGGMKAFIVVVAVSSIVLIGHFAVNPMFRMIANTGLRELFTAFALSLVIGIAVLMSAIGLSPALGTFIAGVVLASSEYRHELEGTIRPFKGLLLGVFFITVGAGIDLSLLMNEPGQILAVTLLIMVIKFIVLFLLCKLFKLEGRYQWLIALSLAQAGEFGFVLLSFAVQNLVIAQALADRILLVIALSMMLTPLLFIFFDKVISPRQAPQPHREADNIDKHSSVIIIGHGRVGQIVNRMLRTCGYKATVLDLDADNISGFSKYNIKTFFGDGSRPELLKAAKIQDATTLVIAIDDRDKVLEITRYVRHVYPDVAIVARAYDRNHYYALKKAGATHVSRETFAGSMSMARNTLLTLGMSVRKSRAASKLFTERDHYLLKTLVDLYDPDLPRFGNPKIFEAFQTANEETVNMMDQLLGKDKADEIHISDESEAQLSAEMTQAIPSESESVDNDTI